MAGHVAAQIRGNYVPIPSSSSDNSHTPIACTHCHRPGHTENTCFRKHGFPNQDPRSVKPNNNNSHKVCTHCNRNGHTIDVCYKKHGYPPGHRLYSTKPSQINNAATQSDTNLDSHPSPTETITLTPQQYQILADLFKQSNVKSPNVQINQVGSISTNPSPPGNIVSAIQVHPNHLWLLDSSATDHICTSLHIFSSYHKITPIPIHLPNGQTIHAHYTGTVTFNHQFYLNVLYVPEFSFNFISVSQLIKNLRCTLTFSTSGCIIQGNHNHEKIGLIKQHIGLYIFDAFACSFINSRSHVTCNIQTHNLWHARVGHLSVDRLHILQSKHAYINDDIVTACDACHRAKQKKLPYALSTSHAQCSFDLLHIDI